MNKSYLLFLILFLLFSQTAFAEQQAYSVQTLDTSSGIVSPVSFGIVKDEKGFIWVATRLGVDRYDGLHFKHYSMKESDMRMADDGVRHDLLQNEDGEIYAFSDLGKIFHYNEDIDSFEELHQVKSFLGGHSLHALGIEENRLILGRFNGIMILDRSTLSITSILCPENNIRCIIPFENKTYLVGSEHGLWCLDLAQNSCEQIACPDLDVMSLYYDRDQQRIWMGTKGNGLWTLRLDNTEAIQIPNWEHAIVTSIAPYADSQLLVGTDGSGLLQTSRIFISSLQLLAGTTLEAPNTLPSSAVQAVFVDDMNIWLATYDCGMVLMAPNPLLGVMNLPETKYTSDKYCYDLDSNSEGTVWAAYNRFICQYTNTQSEPKVFLEDKSGFLAIEEYHDGTVWCGGYNSGLFHLDPKTGKYSHVASLTGASVNSSIYDLLEDSHGNLWVGGHNFPLTCIKTKESGISFTPSKEDIVQYDITRIDDMQQLNDSIIVVGAVNGFFLVNMNSGEIRHLLAENDEFGWKGTNFIECIAIKDSHILYIGTDGAGFMIYDTEDNSLRNFTTASHNLPSNYIRGIELSGDSLLWMSTENRGVFSFDIRAEKVKHRLSSATLQTDEYLVHASTTLPNGDILFGGKAGVELIYSSTMDDVTPNINIYLSEIGIGQERRITYRSHPKILDAPLHLVEHIKLPYGEKSLRLQFTTDDIYHQNDHLMVFRLDNTWADWVTMNNQRELNFFTLPVGTHYLYIRCIMSNGQYIEKVFEIEAMQTPWLQWPALLCYLALLLLIIAGVVVTYRKHVENAAAEEKISFFGNVAHDIRTPLSLVSAPLSDLEQYISPDAPENLMPVIKQNLHHLSDVVSQLSLFNSNQQNVQQLNLKAIPFCKFARAITEAYQPLAKHQKLSLEMDIPENEIWILADEQALARICDNVLGNAFKFTKTGGIKVTVRSRGHNGQLEVQDTGIGMSDASRRKLFRHFFRGQNALDEKVSGFGLGMMYTNQAVRKMNGRIACQSQEGKGSTFTISLPLTEAGDIAATTFENEIKLGESASLDTRMLYSGYKQDILLVEDNAEMLKYLAGKLSIGYNVSRATNVAEAKEYLKSHSTDLIISDVMMPGMRGDEWCKEMKNNFETAHIPFILLTANSEYNDQIQTLSYGADEYITKPFDMNMLLIKVKNIFESKRKMHAYYVHTLDVKPKEKTAAKKVPVKKEPSTQRDLDDQFIAQLMSVVDKYISQPDLSVDDLAKEMAMSHTLFYEKIHKLLGIPPASLVRNCRMKRAKELLLEGEHSIAEVAIMCGFSDAKYFSTAFKKYYGCSPSKIS